MRRGSSVVAAALAICATLMMASPGWAQRVPRFERESVNGRDAVAREVLVKFRDAVAAQELLDIASQIDALSIEPIGSAGTLRLRSRTLSAADLVRTLSSRLDVLYAEPNHVVRIATVPNDPRLEDLWGLDRIQAPAAWDLTVGTGSNVVVGVIDTGIDYTHPDLAANIWSAPSAYSVTLSSGVIHCAAGTHGFNAITRHCDPMDDHNHGTHVSGTIGALGNNGVGVVGVNWNARIMGLKFLDEEGSGTMADAIAAVEFAIAVKQAFQQTDAADIRVLSNSWGGTESSQALLDQINAANDAEMLFVVAAGNNGSNNDIFPFFPAGYSAPNMVTVAATTLDDSRTWFSNYGRLSVHLGAPGDTILSTTIGDTYGFSSGTSMAAPHVSGAAALVLSLCTLDTAALREALLGTVDYVSDLTDTSVTGGRLNVNSALHSCTAPPDVPASLTAFAADTRVTLTWSPVLGALRYAVKRSLTPGGPYTVLNDAVSGITFNDTAVVNDTTYYYVVSAANTMGESTDSSEASATPRIPSDLTISVLTTPSVGGAGVALTVSMTVQNQGAGLAPASVTRVYLSSNSILDASDATLSDLAVPQLAPGATHSVSGASIQVPDTTNPGWHFLIVAVDADNLLFETSESNNRITRAIQIGPDLGVNSLGAPSSAGAGSVIAVTDTTRNTGGAAAVASTTSFYLSSNTTFSADDVLLGSRTVAALDAGATNSGTVSVTIPGTTAVGTYYVIAVADAGSVVAEVSETNNHSFRSVNVGGDLVISSFSVPSTGMAGGTIVVNDTTKNQGTGTIGATTTRFYLSVNATLDAGDTLLQEGRAVGALDAGASHAGPTTLTLPTPLAPDSYYVIAKADGNNEATETTETNNWVARYISIGGDLTVSALTAPATAASGSDIDVTDTTANQGASVVAASITRFYLSTNTVLDSGDTLLPQTRAIPELAGGASSVGSTRITLSTGLAAATYYLIAAADDGKSIAETSESNNTRARAIQIGGDLVVSALTVPAKGGAGLPLVINDTTKNQGTGSIGATVTRFYLSTNSTLDSSDVMLGSRDVPSLAGGLTSSGTTTLTIPSTTAPGAYSLFAKTDADGTVTETSESNNVLARTVGIGGDLVVSVPSGVALKAAAGGSFDFSDTVTNTGGGASTPSITRYYLSTNSSLSTDDVLLGGGRDVPALAPGAASAGSTTIWLPASAAPGVFYIVVKADGDATVVETSETNNTAGRQVAVGPDLVTSASSAPSSVVVGSTFNVNDTVLNQGGAEAAPTGTRFYLSSNTSLDANDIALEASRSIGVLAAGVSSAGTTAVTVPATTPPAFYYLLIKADGYNAVGESYENNNLAARAMWVNAAP